MSQKRKILLLGSTPIFAPLNYEQLQFIASETDLVAFDEGTTVFNENSKADSAYLISAGKIVLTQRVRGTRRQIATLGVGCTFGEKALLIETVQAFQAEASTFCSLIQIKRSKYRELLTQFPELAIILHTHIMFKLKRVKRDLSYKVIQYKKKHDVVDVNLKAYQAAHNPIDI